MKNLNLNQMETLTGGILPPEPGEAERCRAIGIASFNQTVGGIGQFGLSPFDFTCFFII